MDVNTKLGIRATMQEVGIGINRADMQTCRHADAQTLRSSEAGRRRMGTPLRHLDRGGDQLRHASSSLVTLQAVI